MAGDDPAAGAARPAPVGQRAALHGPRRPDGARPHGRPPCSWSASAPAGRSPSTPPTWLVAAALLLPGPAAAPRTRRSAGGQHAPRAREGWTLFRSTTWLWVVVLGFGVLNAIHAGAWFTLGPAIARDTIGVAGLGLRRSPPSPSGLLLMTAVLLRVRAPATRCWPGCSAARCSRCRCCSSGLDPHVVAAGRRDVARRRRDGGLRHRLEPRDAGERRRRRCCRAPTPTTRSARSSRSRSASCVYGPLGEWFGTEAVLVASAIAYAGVCLLVLASPAVRNLERSTAEPVLSTTSSPSR